MSMTADVKEELSRAVITEISARRAEVSTLLRFAGRLDVVGGRAVLEAEFDTASVAWRVRREVAELFGHHVDVQMSAAASVRNCARYTLRVVTGATSLARQAALLDVHGRPVRGLSPQIVAGSTGDAAAAWRGAFLAHGSLGDPGRSTSLEIGCPSPETALALVGAARRLGVSAKAGEIRGADRVSVRDGDAIVTILTRLGARNSGRTWADADSRRKIRDSAGRSVKFDDANLRRSTQAASAASARAERALEILGADTPDHLVEAGKLRMEHGQLSLDQLGQLADPPITKDAIAGRIRRLLAMADRRAHRDGIPDTESVITSDMLS